MAAFIAAIHEVLQGTKTYDPQYLDNSTQLWCKLVIRVEFPFTSLQHLQFRSILLCIQLEFQRTCHLLTTNRSAVLHTIPQHGIATHTTNTDDQCDKTNENDPHYSMRSRARVPKRSHRCPRNANRWAHWIGMSHQWVKRNNRQPQRNRTPRRGNREVCWDDGPCMIYLLETPHGKSILFYYARKYATYHSTFNESGFQNALCFMCGEIDGNRGCNEIVSIVREYLTILDDRKLNEVSLYPCTAITVQASRITMKIGRSLILCTMISYRCIRTSKIYTLYIYTKGTYK